MPENSELEMIDRDDPAVSVRGQDNACKAVQTVLKSRGDNNAADK